MFVHEESPAAKILHATRGEEQDLQARLDEYTTFRLITKVNEVPFASLEITREDMNSIVRVDFPGLTAVEGYAHGSAYEFWETL